MVFFKTFFFISLFISFPLINASNAIVIWHGIDNCFDQGIALKIHLWISHARPNTYIKMVKIGSTCREDSLISFTLNPYKQIQYVCSDLLNDNRLENGFDAIGISQGSLFFRGLIQKCPLNVKQFISIGGPQMGIFGIPDCDIMSVFFKKLCKILVFIQKIAQTFYSGFSTPAIYSPIMHKIRNYYTVGHYWNDPSGHYSNFLTDINNLDLSHPEYKIRLVSLNKMVLIQFTDDKIIKPSLSEFFGEYYNYPNIIPFNETQVYKLDSFGLKTLHQENKIFFLKINAHHVEVSRRWFKKNIIDQFL